MQKYRIVQYVSEWGVGNTMRTLTKDNTFAIATNNPRYFDSPQDASTTWCTQLAYKYHVSPELAKHLVIVGERGGHYRINSGKRYK